MKWIMVALMALLGAGCLSPQANALLVGAGIGAGAVCKMTQGDMFCTNKKSAKPPKEESLWEKQDPRFPDASIPYLMY